MVPVRPGFLKSKLKWLVLSKSYWKKEYFSFTTTKDTKDNNCNSPQLFVFTALHAMQTRSSDEKSVCPSVRLSVKRVDCDKTEERSVQIIIQYNRSFSLIFWEEEWLVEGRPLLPEILGQPTPIGAKSPIFHRYSPIAPHSSAVTPREKSSINTNRKSTMPFQMSLRWLSYVAAKSPKGDRLKNAKQPISV